MKPRLMERYFVPPSIHVIVPLSDCPSGSKVEVQIPSTFSTAHRRARDKQRHASQRWRTQVGAAKHDLAAEAACFLTALRSSQCRSVTSTAPTPPAGAHSLALRLPVSLKLSAGRIFLGAILGGKPSQLWSSRLSTVHHPYGLLRSRLCPCPAANTPLARPSVGPHSSLLLRSAP